MLAVLAGTGTSRSAFNVHLTGSSILREFVCLFQINAKPSIALALALAATQVMISVMENVPFLPQSPYQTLDALLGTGTNKFAFSAHLTGFSIQIMSVYLSLTNARPLTILVPALAAMLATIWLTENARSQHQSQFLMLAVLLGTGTSRPAFNAHPTGSLTLTMSVSLSLINARHLITPEHA